MLQENWLKEEDSINLLVAFMEVKPVPWDGFRRHHGPVDVGAVVDRVKTVGVVHSHVLKVVLSEFRVVLKMTIKNKEMDKARRKMGTIYLVGRNDNSRLSRSSAPNQSPRVL